MIECLKCGKRNTKKSKFCYKCGSPLKVGHGSSKHPPAVRIITPLNFSPPSSMANPRQIIEPKLDKTGNCFYHSKLPATHVCNRCGKPICQNCVKPYMQIMFCPKCFRAH